MFVLLDAAFRFYGLEDLMMVQLASYGVFLPYLLMIVIACCFALAGLYGLSAAGDIRPLPLLKFGIAVICFVFLGRAVWSLINMVIAFTPRDILTIFIALEIGICYLLGSLLHYRN